MRVSLEQRIAAALCTLVIEVPVDPDVAAIDADAARVVTQAQEHGDRGRARTQVLQRAARGPGAPPDLTECGQQAVERVGGTDGGDDDRGAVDAFADLGASVVHDADPDRRPVLGEDLGDLLPDADSASGLLNALLKGAGDPRAPTAGEPGALEVVGDDQRVHGKGRSGRRQAVVPPLTGQDGLEPGGAEVGIQIRLRRLSGSTASQALGRPEQRGRRPGDHPLDEAQRRPPCHPANILEVAVNGSGLLRECVNQVALVPKRIAADTQLHARVDEPVVGVGHAVPLQLAAGEVVEVGAALASGTELTDVVHPHVPGGAVTPEGVRQSARFRMPLQDQNSLAAGPRQQAGSRQASNTRTDHDDVVGHP